MKKEKNNRFETVLVFGLGVSGISALRMLVSERFLSNRLGLKKIILVNQGPEKIWGASDELEEIRIYARERLLELETYSQEDVSVAELFKTSTYIVVSPGIPLTHKLLSGVDSSKIGNEIDLCFEALKLENALEDLKVVGITGTNGKTTTASLLRSLVRSLGEDVFLGGNIGIGLSEYYLHPKPPKFMILELSSFQLENLKNIQFEASLITNITAAHSERYADPRSYAQAKMRIFALTKSSGLKLLGEFSSDLKTTVENQQKDLGPWEIVPAAHETFPGLKDLKPLIIPEMLLDGFLRWTFNQANLWSCTKILQKLFPEVQEKNQSLQDCLKVWSAPTFRLMEMSSPFPDLKIFNDSKSTNFESLSKALENMNTKNLWLIIGGQFRGGEKGLKGKLWPFRKKFQKVFLFGSAAKEFAEELKELPLIVSPTLRSCLEEALPQHQSDFVNVKGSGVLLFSPGFPSFDEFRSYEERGKFFQEALEKWKTPKGKKN